MKTVIGEALPPRASEKVFRAYMPRVPSHRPYFDEEPDPQTCGDDAKNEPAMQILACPCHLSSSACDTCSAPYRRFEGPDDDVD